MWAKSAEGDKNASGFSIDLDSKNNIYIAGSFAGKIGFGGGFSSLQCMDESNDAFFAKYTNDGQFKWVLKSGLDTYPQGNYLTYMTIVLWMEKARVRHFSAKMKTSGIMEFRWAPWDYYI